jgi:hypothetical protein
MIAEATKDASARAKSIAENADANLGSLKKSDMGVFKLQVKTPEDFSYGGSFNINQKIKRLISRSDGLVNYFEFNNQVDRSQT